MKNFHSRSGHPAAPRLEPKFVLHSRSRGVTLLEALITLLVMSIGLLGMAALQLIGVQENASALRHSQATWLAYDMADRMRANRNFGTLAAPVALNNRADHYNGVSVDAATAVNNPNCADADGCNFNEMKDFDSDEWRALVIALPGGLGTVTEEADGRFYVRVLWDDDVAAGADTTGCPSDTALGNIHAQTCVEIVVEP